MEILLFATNFLTPQHHDLAAVTLQQAKPSATGTGFRPLQGLD
jgi:hypothetical protein